MPMDQQPLRLRKKHGSGAPVNVSAEDGGRLVQAQSLRNAVVAALIVIILFSMFWITLSELTNRIYPWLTVVLGFVLGHSIRLAGRGTDWRFPTMAAVLALIGSLVSNIAVAASVTAEGFGIGTLEILQAVTSMTWPVFFRRSSDVCRCFFCRDCRGASCFLCESTADAQSIPRFAFMAGAAR